MSKKPIVIIGGGPTGLAAAYQLSKAGKSFVLIDKEKNLGGLSATLKYDNFLYEYGPHAFHLKDPEITDWLKKLLGKEFRVIPTQTRVLINGQMLDYPLRGADLLRKISPFLAIKIIFEYLLTYLKATIFKSSPQNFEEWGLKNFGPALYKISFGDYTQKVWGMHPKEISAQLASQKLSRLSLSDIILKLLGFQGKNQPAYFKKYLYPKSGASLIFSKMTAEIKKHGKILLGSKVIHLKQHQDRIEAIEYRDLQGKNHLINCQSVISTLVLKDLIPMINSPLKTKITKSADKLQYRDLIIIYLIADKKYVPSAQWIYLVEKDFIFNRVTIGENLSSLFAPKNKTVLAFEICCQKGDKLWQSSDKKILELLWKDLARLGWKDLKISDFFVRRLSNAYPIFLVGFEDNLKITLAGLSQVKNLVATGRNGLFLNSDIHDCFQMGFETAKFFKQDQFQPADWYRKAEKRWFNQ